MDKVLKGYKQILLVGEGNFSFSSTLQQNLPAGVNVVATCFESSLPSSCGAQENKDKLEDYGATVLFGVDATKLESQSSLCLMKPFDCIIFQFPHVGGKGNIKKNRNLLKDFFISASKVLSQTGMVLVTLCNGQGGTPQDNPQREWRNSWQVVAMATYGDFILTQTIPFDEVKCRFYQSTGYRGQDKSFNVSGAVMHVFHRSQTHPASWVTEDKNEVYSRILKLQNQMYAKVMDLFLEDLGEYSREDVDMNERHNEKDSISCEYAHMGTEYVVAAEIEKKKPYLNIQKLSSNQSRCRETPRHMSGFTDFMNAIVDIHDHCCISSLLQNVSDGITITPFGVELVHKSCPISQFSYPIMHYVIVTMQKTSSFEGFQEKVMRSLDQECRTEDDVTATEKRKNSFDWLESYDLETQCDDCHRIIANSNDETISFNRRIPSRDGDIVPLSCTFLQGGEKVSVVFCLEHFVMNKFKIEDIRILWSCDERWWRKFSQFVSSCGSDGLCHVQFFSLYPPLYVHDVSFWESPGKEFDESAFISVVRDAVGDNVRELHLVETFQLGERRSRCYRMIYQSCDQALTSHEAGRLQMIVRKFIKDKLDLTPR